MAVMILESYCGHNESNMRGHFFRPAQSCHLEMPKTIESVGGEVILDL